MRTLQEKYNGVLEGKFSKTQFRRDAAMELPQFVSNVNSFDDTVAILKNKGIVSEVKAQEPKYSTAKPQDQVAPDVLDTGIKFELDKKYGTLDVTPEQYEQCRAMAAKNLAKDVLYYVKQDSEQLEAPGEKMEKVTLKEETDVLFARKLKAAGHDYDKMMYDLGDAVVDGKGLEDASAEELKIYAQIALRRGDDIDVVNAFEYLESLPNYKPEFTPERLRKVAEVKVEKTFADGRKELALDGKEMSDEEADEFIKRAKEHGATPMNTKFTKVNEEEVEEAIQNIENDAYTIKRIAGMVNQLLLDNPADENLKAYAVSVKNDLESGDASRLKRYKDVFSMDDLKDDMEHYISHDVDQLEENQIVDLPMTAAGYSRGETYDTEKYGKVKIIDQLDGDDIPAAYGRFRVEKINEEDLDATEKAASAKIGKGEEFTDDDAAAVADKMPKIKKDAEFKLIGEDEPDVEDLYQHDQEYLDTLKQRKALKEMFKKIIVNLINE